MTRVLLSAVALLLAGPASPPEDPKPVRLVSFSLTPSRFDAASPKPSCHDGRNCVAASDCKDRSCGVWAQPLKLCWAIDPESGQDPEMKIVVNLYGPIEPTGEDRFPYLATSGPDVRPTYPGKGCAFARLMPPDAAYGDYYVRVVFVDRKWNRTLYTEELEELRSMGHKGEIRALCPVGTCRVTNAPR
jgi:hypothetical protein